MRLGIFIGLFHRIIFIQIALFCDEIGLVGRCVVLFCFWGKYFDFFLGIKVFGIQGVRE
jgi:hypothetical protein